MWLRHYASVRLRIPQGPRTGSVGYEKHWRFPCGARTMPVRAPHGVPRSYFEDFSHDKLVICFSSCNLPFCGLIGNISVTFVEIGLLITPIYFVIEAQIHTNSYTLQRCQMTVMSSRITGQQTVCSTLNSDKQHRNIRGPYYRPFVKGIHRWRVDSSHMGTVTQNTFSFDDVIM